MSRSALPVMRRRYPAGYWLCEHSTLPGFEAGKRYACFQENGAVRDDGSIEAAKDRSYRIYPDAEEATGWAPYWQADEGRFCYGDSALRLRYVRAFWPWEHRALVERNGLAQRVRLHDLRAQRRFNRAQDRLAAWEARVQARRSHLSRAMDQVDIAMIVSMVVIAAFLAILAVAV